MKKKKKSIDRSGSRIAIDEIHVEHYEVNFALQVVQE